MLDIRTKTIDRKSLETFTNETKLKNSFSFYSFFDWKNDFNTHQKNLGPNSLVLIETHHGGCAWVNSPFLDTWG